MIPEAVRAVDRVVDSLGLSGAPLSAADLIQSARRSVGLADFGVPSLEDPLEALLRSYEREASLSVFGRLAARWDAVRFLSNLLVLREAEKRVPAILDQSIDRPIFITGLPRTGTTFLHNLLAQDHSNRVVRVWETIYPGPGQGGTAPRPDRRPRQVDRQLAMFRKLAPEFGGLYPMTAHSPQECTEITAHVFRSLRFDTTHAVPTYRRWLDDAGHVAAYQFHKRFLKHLQYWSGRGRWVLKCPDHVFALDAIHEVYPDARFIFVHRNPLEVLPSVARLTDVLRRPFTRRVDRFEIGRQVGERWDEGAATLVRVAQEARPGPDQVFHLKFRNFVRAPFDSIAAIYRHFGVTFSPEEAERIQRFAAERPDGGYGRHRTRLDEYGLDRQAKRRGYQDYAAYFGV